MNIPEWFPPFCDRLWLLAVILLVVLVPWMCGCASSTKMPCPECEQEIVRHDVIVPCIVPIAPLEAGALPEYPEFPGDDADEAALKDWALRFGEAAEQRETLWRARDAAWLAKVEAHNGGSPMCSGL